MGIDTNDLKILITAGFQYLVTWAKDHPLVSGVLLFFYLLYIFFPYIFGILFYTFPFVICTAILLGGPRISAKQYQEITNNIKKEADKSGVQTVGSSDRRRRRLTPQMSRRTIGKDKNKDMFRREATSKVENKDHAEGALDDMAMKTHRDICTAYISNDDKISAPLYLTSDNAVVEKTLHNFTEMSSRSDTESEDDDDDDEPQEAINKVVQWTEEDQRNLRDLGSSEIERNKRLETLIEKRKARKLFSMQPRRAYYPYESLMGHVGSIIVTRCLETDNQPGSAPCALLPSSRNPFDLPYEPHEERPILRGGSFDEEFFPNEQKESYAEQNVSRHENLMGEITEDPVGKSPPSFCTKPKKLDRRAFTRFRRESEESIKELSDELFKTDPENDQIPDWQESSTKVRKYNNDDHQDEESHELVNPFASTEDPVGADLYGQEALAEGNGKRNNSLTDAETNSTRDGIQPTRKDKLANKDQDDGEESSSSSSEEVPVNIDVVKNEAFRHSVRKVLNCLLIQRNREQAIRRNADAPTSSNVFGSSPNDNTPTKMQERSFYTERPNHVKTYSIASDMQVEVSEIGSPPLATIDPTSPTDRDTLVYDGDVDKDANSGDEDLLGTSPQLSKIGEFATKPKLPEVIEESNISRVSNIEGMHNDSDPNTLSREQLEEEVEQEPATRTSSSLSPTSILPDEKMHDIVDQKSINGDIIEPRLSVSSSSDSLTSQMQAKSEHVAEYLANLPTSESSAKLLENPEPSHFQEQSVEENTIQADTNPIFEMDEDKEESRESKGLEESQGSSEQSTITSQIAAPKRTSSASNEYIEGDQHDNQSTRTQEKSATVETDDREDDTNVREPLSDHKEEISDSFSTTSQEGSLEQSKLEEEPSAKMEDSMKTKSENGNEGEVNVESLTNSTIHDDQSTPLENVAAEVNQVVYNDITKTDVDETSI